MHRQRSQVLILFALALTALFAFISLGLDVGNVLVQRRVLQTAADTAASSVAAQLAMSATGSTISNAACMYLQANQRTGSTYSIASMIYEDSSATSLGDVFNGSPSCDSTCTQPPLSACSARTANNPPPTATQVKLTASTTFNT